VVVDASGEKRSKQSAARQAGPAELPRALELLGFAPPRGVAGKELLDWACAARAVARLPRLRSVRAVATG
jgi:hypothetical protein